MAKPADLRGGQKPLPALRPTAPVRSDAPPPTIVQPNRDLSLLHPEVRLAVRETILTMNGRGIPFRVFEAYRSPDRQAYLYAQGRTRPGGVVTKARPWESYHQYGLAADLVLFVDGKWSWDTSGVAGEYWNELHEVGEAYGLEPLSFEKPHLQLVGLTIAQLKAGQFPAGGDETWWSNLKVWKEKWGRAEG